MSWYDKMMGKPSASQMQFTNPMQKAAYIMQAMTNPAEFVRQNIPDLPKEIANDPNQILSFLQRTRGITNEQIQQIVQQNPYPGRY